MVKLKEREKKYIQSYSPFDYSSSELPKVYYDKFTRVHLRSLVKQLWKFREKYKKGNS